MKKYTVRLTDAERKELLEVVTKLKGTIAKSQTGTNLA